MSRHFIIAFVMCFAAIGVAASQSTITFEALPTRVSVGESFQVTMHAPATRVSPRGNNTFSLLKFRVVSANDTSSIDAYRDDAVRLYWCDPTDANMQLSPNAVADNLILQMAGDIANSDLTQTTSMLEALGMTSGDALNAMTSPSTYMPATLPGDSSLAICGSLGFGAYANTGSSVVVPTLYVEITATSASGMGTASVEDPEINVTHSMAVQPAHAITVEIDEASLWCRAAGTSSFASTERMRARVTQQLPSMRLRFFDPWGNPAVTAVEDAISVRYHVPIPYIPLEATNRAVAIPVGAGAAVATIPAASILGPLATETNDLAGSQALLSSSRTGQHLVRTDVTMQRVAQGGRTFRTCGELYLLSGYPQALSVAPAPGEKSHREVDPVASQPVHVVAVDPLFLGIGVAIQVTPLDSAGNPVSISGGSLPACTGFGQVGCIACGQPKSSTEVALLTGIAPRVNDTVATTTWFLFEPSSATSVTDVVCWLQPGFTGSSRVTSNNTDTGLTAIGDWTAATVRTSATLRFQPIGDYECYDASTPFTHELSSIDWRNLRKVFENPVLDFIPFTTLRLSMRSASGNRILRNPRGEQDEVPPFLSDHPMAEWIIVPRRGFVDIPLGMMTVLAFGQTYSRTSSVFINMTRPVCDDTDYRQMENAVSTWLYELGDNATFFYEEKRPTVDSANNVDIDLRVCYGTGLESLEFVSTTCCNRLGLCGTTDTKSILSYVLLVGAAVVSLAAAIFTVWYVNAARKRSTVHLTPRYNLDVAEKTRVVLTHLLAPWIVLAHMYFTFEVQNTQASVLWYMDIAVCVIWPIGVAVRAVFPLHNFSPHVYLFAANLLLLYSQWLMGNAVVWMVSALNLSVRLLPFATALVLVMTQIFWAVLWAEEMLGKGVLSEEIPSHSIIPLDAALGVEYFAIIATLFMFAVGQVEDLSPFFAVVAAVVVVMFFWLYNFSISSQVTAYLKKHLGDESETSVSGGVASAQAQRRQMLQRVMSLGTNAAAPPGPPSGGAVGAVAVGGAAPPEKGQMTRQQSAAFGGDLFTVLHDKLRAPSETGDAEEMSELVNPERSSYFELGNAAPDTSSVRFAASPSGGGAPGAPSHHTTVDVDQPHSHHVPSQGQSPPSASDSARSSMPRQQQAHGATPSSALKGSHTAVPPPRRRSAQPDVASPDDTSESAPLMPAEAVSPGTEQRLQHLARQRTLDQVAGSGLI